MSPSPSPSTRRRQQTPDPATPDLAETPGWAEVPPATPQTEDGPATPTTGPSNGAEPGSPAARTPGSSPSALEKMTRAGLTEAAETGFRGVGDAMNAAAAADDEDDVWLTRDAEARSFGKAAGRMLARRMPDTLGDNAADASDLLAVVVAVGVWAIRNLAEWLPRGRGNLFPRAKGRHRIGQAADAEDQDQ